MAEPDRRCQCNAFPGNPEFCCQGTMTAEDLLCDGCRKNGEPRGCIWIGDRGGHIQVNWDDVQFNWTH